MATTRLCTPAIVYLVLSIVALFVGAKVFTIIHVLGIILWTFILNYLCSIGLTTISWILVLLPIIIMFGIILSIMSLPKH
jgi:hypothetical protein